MPNENTSSIEHSDNRPEPGSLHEFAVCPDTVGPRRVAFGMPGTSSGGRQLLFPWHASEFAGMGSLTQTGRPQVAEKNYQEIVRRAQPQGAVQEPDRIIVYG